jgi:hypothetical protein
VHALDLPLLLSTVKIETRKLQCENTAIPTNREFTITTRSRSIPLVQYAPTLASLVPCWFWVLVDCTALLDRLLAFLFQTSRIVGQSLRSKKRGPRWRRRSPMFARNCLWSATDGETRPLPRLLTLARRSLVRTSRKVPSRLVRVLSPCAAGESVVESTLLISSYSTGRCSSKGSGA